MNIHDNLHDFIAVMQTQIEKIAEIDEKLYNNVKAFEPGQVVAYQDFRQDIIDLIKQEGKNQYQDREIKELAEAAISHLCRSSPNDAAQLIADLATSTDHYAIVLQTLRSKIDWNATYTAKTFALEVEYEECVREVGYDPYGIGSPEYEDRIYSDRVTINNWCPLLQAAFDNDGAKVHALLGIKAAAVNARAVIHQLYQRRAKADSYHGTTLKNTDPLDKDLPQKSEIAQASALLVNCAKQQGIKGYFNPQKMDYTDKRLLVASAKQKLNAVTEVQQLLEEFKVLSTSEISVRRHFSFFSSLPNSMLQVVEITQKKAGELLKALSAQAKCKDQLQQLKDLAIQVRTVLYSEKYTRQFKDDYRDSRWNLNLRKEAVDYIISNAARNLKVNYSAR